MMQPIKRVNMVVDVGRKPATNSNSLRGGYLVHREVRKRDLLFTINLSVPFNFGSCPHITLLLKKKVKKFLKNLDHFL